MLKDLLKELEKNEYYLQALRLAKNDEEREKVKGGAIRLLASMSPVLEGFMAAAKDPEITKVLGEELGKKNPETSQG